MPFRIKISFVIACLIIGISAISSGKSGDKIEILQADYLKGSNTIDPDLRKLIGNVVLRHNFTLMFCDSAYLYPSRNIFEAYNNVKIVQGDSVTLECKYLKYDGNENLAHAINDVKLMDKDMTLYTSLLDFNTEFSVGNYYYGGKIINKKTVLTSQKGTYNSKKKEFHFKNNVVVKDPQYEVYSDTLKYLSDIEKVFFLGPTTIILDTNTIKCEYGWYEVKDSVAQFEKNASIVNNSQKVTGDLLYYNQSTKKGKGRKNVQIFDIKRDIIVKGNIADFDRKTEYFTVTDSALLIMITEGDSIFIHADTLCSLYDTTAKNRILKAYYKVKIFKSDIQSKCDSMVYSSADSIIKLFYKPIIWSGENQISANYIEIYIKNRKFDKIKMNELAFLIAIEDTSKFNQVKGKNMTGYFKNNELYKIDVNGNGQSVYFPKEKQKVIGINKIESSDMRIYIENKKIKRIICLTAPTARLIPLKDATQEDYKLKDFNWLDYLRPRNKDDIFIMPIK
jgi:lipopolysaccharide export system protein LptA